MVTLNGVKSFCAGLAASAVLLLAVACQDDVYEHVYGQDEFTRREIAAELLAGLPTEDAREICISRLD
jgi:hypothetical protein